MWDLSAFFVSLGIVFTNLFGLNNAAIAAANAAWKGAERAFLRADEMLGKFLAGLIARIMLFNVVVLLGVFYAAGKVNASLRYETAQLGDFVLLTEVFGGAAVCLGAMAAWQWRLGKTQPRRVSLLRSAFVNITALGVSSFVLIIQTMETWSDGFLCLALFLTLYTILNVAALGVIAGWALQKGINLVETGLELVGEPVLTLLPVTTGENVKARTRGIFDLIDQNMWARRFTALAPMMFMTIFPLLWMQACAQPFKLGFGFSLALSMSYSFLVCGIVYGMRADIGSEITEQQKRLARLMLFGTMPLMMIPRIGFHLGFTFSMKNYGWGLPLAIGVLSVLVLYIMADVVKGAKLIWKLVGAGIPALAVLWSFASLMVWQQDVKEWFPFAKAEAKDATKAASTTSEPSMLDTLLRQAKANASAPVMTTRAAKKEESIPPPPPNKQESFDELAKRYGVDQDK
jgi:hypothetical protein